MTKPLNLKFDEKFKISTKALYLNRSHPYLLRNLKWKIQFSVYISVYIFCVVLLSYSVFIHDVPSRQFVEASKNGTMLIVAINIIYKYALLLLRQKDIKELMNFVDRDYNEDNEYSDEDRAIVLEYANKGVNVCKMWLFGGTSACLIFPMKAFVCMAYYYWIGEFKLVAMFDLTLPEPLNTYKRDIAFIFTMWFLLTFLFDVFTITMHVGFDSIIPILLLHVCGQMVLLSQRLSKLFVQFKDPKAIEGELKKVIIKLQTLYEFMESLKECFAILYECNMKTSTFLIPFIGILIVQDLNNVWKNPEYVIFMCCSILHFFIPCYYSDLLMEQSDNFYHAIYSCGWQECPHKGVRQMILFMLTKAETPMGIRTIFYSINLDTFAEMCRQAYGIFNVINASSL